jgi:hypothetical protein
MSAKQHDDDGTESDIDYDALGIEPVEDVAPDLDVEDVDEKTMMKRRRVLQVTAIAATAAAGVGSGAGSALARFGDETINFGYENAHDPWLNGTVTVSTHEPGFSQLDYIHDSYSDGDEPNNLTADDGIVLADRPTEGEPHNPVTLMASNFESGEYTDFPRGASYDEDGDGSADTDVMVTEATHWGKDVSGSAGSMTIADDGTGLRISTSSQTSGDTAIATFDLSTVADTDQTITDGMSRRFLQLVRDIDTLESGVTVDYAVIDSTGTEVVASDIAGGDTSLVDVLRDATGASRADQVRVGELENADSVTLNDIEQLQIRISDANADVKFYGVNLERTSKWVFGTQEYLNSDSEVDTQTVEEPAGSYSITGLDTLDSVFDSATLNDVEYDVQMVASEADDAEIHARVKDLDDTYDRPHELEFVAEYHWPDHYELSTTAEDLRDNQEFPSGRYLGAEAATGTTELESWDDVDNVSWTDRTGDYGSAGTETQLISSTSTADRSAVRLRLALSADEVDAYTSATSGGAAVAATNDGGPGAKMWTIIGAIGTGLLVWKRKALAAIFG